MFASSSALGNHVHDAAVLDDVVAVGDRLRETEILLDQQDGEPLLLQPRDRASDLLHDHRREALGRLVEKQQARASAQDPADREHLLLAAGKLGALAPQPLLQVREQLEDLLDRRPPVATCGGSSRFSSTSRLAKMPRSSGQNAMPRARSGWK